MIPPNFKVLTLGCKVNQFESRALEEKLIEGGAAPAREGGRADLVVINTCTVTARSDADARALIRRARRENPGARVVVAGCYAALEPGEALKAGADFVHASADKGGLADLALSGAVGISTPARRGPLAPEPVGSFAGRKRAYLKVQDGCECFCAYCIVPHARGPSRSLPPSEVARGLERLKEGGHREVVLTGIHLGFWGRDLEPASNILELLEIAEKSGIDRIRLSSIEPMEVSEELIAAFAGSKALCPHLHIPLQSGSDRVLRAMGRPYTQALARGRIDSALAALPGLCLGFDVITGFPGETAGEFAETEGFLASLPLAYLHVFPFSPRRGTPAADMEGQVDRALSAARAKRLRELSAAKRAEFHRAAVGSAALMLPENRMAGGALRGRTANYLDVEVEWRGQMPVGPVAVDLVGWNGTRLKGIIREGIHGHKPT